MKVLHLILIIISSTLITSKIGAQDNCKEEAASGLCTSCNENYFLQDGKCLSCGAGFSPLPYKHGAFLACDTCINGCASCKGRTYEECYKCAKGFFFNHANKSCDKCIENCAICKSEKYSECLRCEDGYFLESSLKKCSICSEGCKICYGPYFDGCYQCKTGYYKGATKCELCAAGCKTCSGAEVSQCIEPMEGYYISGEQIKKCGGDCLKCDKNSSDKCETCAKGFYLSNESTCEKCLEHCELCRGYKFEECSECELGYYKNNATKQCDNCIKNCKTCVSDSYTGCLTCDDGYYKDRRTQECKSCPFPCLSCKNDYICSECLPGYELRGNICMKRTGIITNELRNEKTPLLALSEIYNYEFRGKNYRQGISFKIIFYTFSAIKSGHSFNSLVYLQKYVGAKGKVSQQNNKNEKIIGNDVFNETRNILTCTYNGEDLNAINHEPSRVEYVCLVDTTEYNIAIIPAIPPQSVYISDWPTDFSARNLTIKTNEEPTFGEPTSRIIIEQALPAACSKYYAQVSFKLKGKVSGSAIPVKSTFQISLLYPELMNAECTTESGESTSTSIMCTHNLFANFTAPTIFVGTQLSNLDSGQRVIIKGNYNLQNNGTYCEYIEDDGLFKRGFGIWEMIAIVVSIIIAISAIIFFIWLYNLIKKLRGRAASYIRAQENSAKSEKMEEDKNKA